MYVVGVGSVYFASRSSGCLTLPRLSLIDAPDACLGTPLAFDGITSSNVSALSAPNCVLSVAATDAIDLPEFALVRAKNSAGV